MKKVIFLFVLAFLVFGILLHAPLVFADKGKSTDNKGSDSNSGSNSIKDNSGNSEDDDENETEIENEEDDNDEENETRIRSREITTADGREVKIERKIRIKDGEVEIRTRLKVEGNGTNFSVVDSEGERHRVRVTPERLRMLIMESLGADNITGFSLDEIEHKNIPRVVLKVNSDHPGRFLGIFKLAVKAETQIDLETGEILDVNTPWWVFLVVGQEIPDSDEIVGNETLENEVVASDDELEEEFGDIEVDEELEVKAETFNGTSEIKVELEFATDATGQEQIINEILARLSLSSGDVNNSLEVEESDEAIEDEEKLEVEAEIEEGFTDVEFELKFVVNSDNRDEIINAILTRLSVLTAEDINGVFSLETEDDEEDEDEEDELEEEETNETTNETANSTA